MTVGPCALPTPATATASGAMTSAASASGTAGTSADGGFLAMLLAALPTPTPHDEPGTGGDSRTDGPDGPDGTAQSEAWTGAGTSVVDTARDDVAQGDVPRDDVAQGAVTQEAVAQGAVAREAATRGGPTASVTGVGPEVGRTAHSPAGMSQPGAAPALAQPAAPQPVAAHTTHVDPSTTMQAGNTGTATSSAGIDISTLTPVAAAPGPDAGAESPAHTTSTASTANTANTANAVVGTSATGSTPAPAPSVPTSGSAPAPMAQQILPEVSRLVSRGDGTHRLTLTLSPEALGDVRITLIVAHGKVSVDFEAGSEAQRALMESAPELRRLLELTGATETRVSARDVQTPAGQGTPGQNPSGSHADSEGGASEPGPQGQDATGTRRDTQDQHARTRDGQSATDGTPSGAGETRRPLDPVASTRTAGLDVTV